MPPMIDLPDGYYDLPPGTLANVVTCLEMRARPEGEAQHAPVRGCTIERIRNAPLGWYRDMFRAIGAPYLWFSRLKLSDAELAATLADDRIETYAIKLDDTDAGLLELDFREPRECELTFFGLLPFAMGRGAGRYAMTTAIERAWSQPIDRFWLHTCTFDAPTALAFYMRSGFTPYKRQIELHPDPRLTNLLPKTAAPNIPQL